ncbi:hypothetical protein JCM10207_008741, partial [Rhodosporidiobolus poonsookiae]
HVALYSAVTGATEADATKEASYIRGGRTASPATRRRIFEHLEKEIEVYTSDTGDERHRMRCGQTGTPLYDVCMPSSPVEFAEQSLKLRSAISIDHHYQMSLELQVVTEAPPVVEISSSQETGEEEADGDEEMAHEAEGRMLKKEEGEEMEAEEKKVLVTTMNNPINTTATSWLFNNMKHRYNGTLHGLGLLSLQNTLKRGEGFNGDIEDGAELIAGTVRIIKIAKPAYALHAMPCPVAERVFLPLASVIFVNDVDHALMKALGISFFKPMPTIEDLVPELTRLEIETLAAEELQQKVNDVFAQSGRALDLERDYPVRPGSNLQRAVSEQLMHDFEVVSNQLESEFSKRGVIFRKTCDGKLIALTMAGTETSTELVQALLRWDPAQLVKNTSKTKYTTLYANALMYVFDVITEKQTKVFAPPRNFVFHDPLLPGLPIMIPPDSKGAFAPSLCRLNHLRLHLLGFVDEALENLIAENWDRDLNNVRLSCWFGNCVDGEGNAERVLENHATALAGVEQGPRDGGEGVLNEDAMWVIDEFGAIGLEKERKVFETMEVWRAKKPKVPEPTVAFVPPKKKYAPRAAPRKPGFLSNEFVADSDDDDALPVRNAVLPDADEFSGSDDEDEEDF